GFDQLMPYLTMAAIFGGVLTVLILMLRKWPLPAPAASWGWAQRLHAANQGVPYGIALAFAALLVLPETSIWRAAIGL
ncbi:MAG: peptidase, partial [Bosea sp. (in: a-proteobacteria)]